MLSQHVKYAVTIYFAGYRSIHINNILIVERGHKDKGPIDGEGVCGHITMNQNMCDLLQSSCFDI